MTYQVRFKDIDPDSGSVENDGILCICPNEKIAKHILNLIEKDWYSEDGPKDPNREFYILKNL